MHRTNFGRSHSARLEKISSAVPAPAGPTREAAPAEPSSRIVNQVVARVEDGLMGQLVFLERLEGSVARMRDAVIAMSDRVGAGNDSLKEQIKELRSCLGHVGSVLRDTMQQLAKEVPNYKGDFDGLRGELAQLGVLGASLKGHGDVLGKLFADHGKAAKAGKLSTSTLLEAITALNARFDAIENKTSTESGAPVDLGPIVEYLRAEKRVIRDHNGDIVGWKVESH